MFNQVTGQCFQQLAWITCNMGISFLILIWQKIVYTHSAIQQSSAKFYLNPSLTSPTVIMAATLGCTTPSGKLTGQRNAKEVLRRNVKGQVYDVLQYRQKSVHMWTHFKNLILTTFRILRADMGLKMKVTKLISQTAHYPLEFQMLRCSIGTACSGSLSTLDYSSCRSDGDKNVM